MDDIAKYLLVLLIGFLGTYVGTPIVFKIATIFRILDIPDSRRIHSTPIPRLGGVAVFLGFHGACLASFWLSPHQEGLLTLIWWQQFFILSLTLLIVGISDDIWNIPPIIKLGSQIAIALVAFSLNIRVNNVLGFDVPLILDGILTVLWIVGLINAFNLIDGLDGLATGLAAISSFGITGALFFRHLPGDACIFLGLIGSCLAFLHYNYYPAKIFLGDCGSMFLGFIISSIALSTGSKGATMASVGMPLLAVGIPVFDTVLAIWRRSIRSMLKEETFNHPKNLFDSKLIQPDMEHLHHRLLQQGLPQHKVALSLYALNGALVLIGLLSLIYRSHAIGIYLIAFVVGAYIIFNHLARIELWDSRQVILKGIQKPSSKVKAVIIYPLMDATLLSFALLIGVFLIEVQLDFSWKVVKNTWFNLLPIQVGIPFLALAVSKTYNRVWSRARILDFTLLVLSLVGGIMLSCGMSILLSDTLAYKKIILQSVVYAGISLPFLTGSRVFCRVLQEVSFKQPINLPHKGNIILYGAGYKAILFLQKNHYASCDETYRNMVGFLDDDVNLRKRYIHGYKVLGTIREIENIIYEHQVNEIIITTDIKKKSLNRLIRVSRKTNVVLSIWQTEETVLYNPRMIDQKKNPLNKDLFLSLCQTSSR